MSAIPAIACIACCCPSGPLAVAMSAVLPNAHTAAQAGAVVIAHRRARRALQHAHAGVHVHACRLTGAARHAADVGGHLVHHVVRQMAVQHPVARIVRDELDVARLRHADQHRVARPPGGLGMRPPSVPVM